MSDSNLKIAAYEQTPLGVLCLRRRRLLNEPGTTVTEITINGEFLMSSYYTASERALAAIALEMYTGHDIDILIGGLGLGYTACEALHSDRVGRVEVVEFLPQVIGWLDAGLIPLAGELRADKRMSVIEGDIYARLAAPPEKKFDMILIDVDHSPGERLDTGRGRFYTREGLEQAGEHLAPGGLLAVWSYVPHVSFTSALRQVFGNVRVEPVTFKNKFFHNEEYTDWLFFAER